MPTAKAGEGGNYKTAEAGTHVALCFACISLGTQDREFAGEKKPPAEHVKFGFELCGEEDTQEDGSRMVVWTKDLMLSLSEKAKLRSLLEGWRGRKFTKEELDGFEVSVVVGHPLLATVSVETSKSGKTYANVSAAAKLVKGMVVPEKGRKPIIYEIANGPDEVFESLPKFIKETIYKSHEATGGFGAWPKKGGKSESMQHQSELPLDQNQGGLVDDPDEVPF